MRRISLFLLPFCAAGYLATPAQAFVGCSLYEHGWWSGSEFRVGRNYQFTYVGDNFNDRASSVSVPNGCWLTFWQHSNFNGEYQILYGGDYPYVGDLWNDQISSVRCQCSAKAKIRTLDPTRAAPKK